MDKKFTMHVDVDSFIPATEEEKAYMVQMRPSSTFFKDGVKRLMKNKVAAISQKEGASFEMCPGSAYEFATNEVMMPRYGKASTSAKLKLSASGLEEDVVYVVPVNIDEVIGTDNWERSSSPYAYVLVKRAYVAPDAGTGTKNDPYNIYNTADLLKMSELLVPGTKIYFRLKADIDMTGIDWVPLNNVDPFNKFIDFSAIDFQFIVSNIQKAQNTGLIQCFTAAVGNLHGNRLVNYTFQLIELSQQFRIIFSDLSHVIFISQIDLLRSFTLKSSADHVNDLIFNSFSADLTAVIFLFN